MDGELHEQVQVENEMHAYAQKSKFKLRKKGKVCNKPKKKIIETVGVMLWTRL